MRASPAAPRATFSVARGLVSVGLSWALVLACNSLTGADGITILDCYEGETQACTCATGRVGSQTCLVGEGFGTCVCALQSGSGGSSSGGSSGSGGTGSSLNANGCPTSAPLLCGTGCCPYGNGGRTDVCCAGNLCSRDGTCGVSGAGGSAGSGTGGSTVDDGLLGAGGSSSLGGSSSVGGSSSTGGTSSTDYIDPITACPAAASGTFRDCGWSDYGFGDCDPGAFVSLGCPGCVGDPILRVCGDGFADCLAAEALTYSDDGSGLCPLLSFTCPAGGEYSWLVAPFSTTNADAAFDCYVEELEE